MRNHSLADTSVTDPGSFVWPMQRFFLTPKKTFSMRNAEVLYVCKMMFPASTQMLSGFPPAEDGCVVLAWVVGVSFSLG